MFFLELLFEDLPTPTSWESKIFIEHAHSVRGSTGAIEQLEKSRNAAKNTCVSLGASTRTPGYDTRVERHVVEVRGDLTKSNVDLQGADFNGNWSPPAYLICEFRVGGRYSFYVVRPRGRGTDPKSE